MTDRAHDIDPEIVDAVHKVANRYGVQGLEHLIAQAQRELQKARVAISELSDLRD